MLLKYTQSEKRSKINGNTRQRGITGNMKLIAGGNVLNSRLPRKTVRGFATKRPASHLRALPVNGREEHRSSIDASDNSNDSGLGFDQHLDVSGAVHGVLRLSEREHPWEVEHSEVKRKKMDIKLESDDANDNFSFSQAMNKSHKTSLQTGGMVPECLMPSRGSAGGSGMQRPLGGASGNGNGGTGNGGSVSRGSLARIPPRPLGVSARRPPGPVSLSSPLLAQSRDGRIQLQIASQPEQQHRARYQTEGSRGAVKDRSGNGFPIVKLIGYSKPATLQVFIGTDMGRVAPHMFYQACKVSGKNSTPCVEKKIDGTVVIEVDFDPGKDMTIICDCVGILKERNVDVEHRFPDQSETRNKKKSTRCRMIFRTTITHSDGSTEVLQTTSHPIVCTQPPGIPEICKKSLSVAPCTGGMELFILGKNFLKDTHVVFQQNDIEPAWEERVQPDKEFLQQTHLVCIIPAYQRCDLIEPVTVRLLVTSSGKTSEPHSFTYMPATNPVLQPAVGTTDISQSCLNLVSQGVSHGCVDLNRVFNKPPLGPATGLILPGSPPKPSALLSGLQNQFLSTDASPARLRKDVHPIRLWTSMPIVGDHPKTEEVKSRDEEQSKVHGLKMMPPPPLLPISARRTSSNVVLMPDTEAIMSSTVLKTEVLDESSQESTQLSPEDLKGIDLRMKPVGPIATVSDLLSTQSPSLATFRRFVSNPSDAPLPTQSGQSVEKYLSRIENPSALKIGNSNGGNIIGSGSTGGSATVAGVTGGATIGSTSSSPSPSQTNSTVQDLPINKLRDTEGALGSQFDSPIMFDPSQASNNSLLTPNIPSRVSEPAKISFDNDITLTSSFGAASSVAEKEQQKPQMVEQTTLQNTLLAVGLNNVVSTNQPKSEYQESSLSGLCSNQSLPTTASLRTPVTDSSLPNFSPASSCNTKSSSLNVPTIINTIGDSSNMIQTNSLIFNSPSQQVSKSLLSTSDVSQTTDEQIIDNSGELCDHTSSAPSVGELGSSHTMLPSSESSVIDSTSLNMSTQPGTIGTNFLSAVTQAESPLVTGTSNTGLDALVSSAIESRILEANHQTQSTEKINVFSTSKSIMSAVSSENSVLNSQAQITLNNTLVSNQNTSATSIHIQEMTLNSTMPVPPVNTFTLNNLNTNQTSVQITQENLILNNTVSAAYNTHILSSDADAKIAEASLTLNPTQEANVNLEPVASGGVSHIVLSNTTCTSPIAMKSIIMGSTNTPGDGDLLSSNVTPSAQISGKRIVSSPTIRSSDECITNTSHTSPIAVKTVLLTPPSEVNNSSVITTNIDMKELLNSTVKEDLTLPTTTSLCTSPIAIKNIILESAPVANNVHSNSTMEMKSMLNSQPADSLVTSVSPGSLPTDKFDALVESTMTKHVLTSTSVQSSSTTSNLNIQGAMCVPTNTLPMTAQSLATILGSNMPSALSINASLNAPVSASPVSETERVLHNSLPVDTIDNANVTLSTQTLQDRAQRVLPTQSQPVTEPSIMSIFSSENESSGKSQPLNSSAVNNTCPSPLNHHLTVFGQQSGVPVHSLLTPNPSSIKPQTLSHSIPFPSQSSNTSNLMSSTPCSLAPKINVSTTEQEGQAEVRLLNEVLMGLTTDNRKRQMSTMVSEDTKINKQVDDTKYVLTSSKCKAAESSTVESCSTNVTSVNVQTVHMQQQQQQKLQLSQQQQPQQDHSIRDQEMQTAEKEQMVSNTPLPVPVTDITSARHMAKDTVPVIQAPTQKRLEEGMVPQELTQMSESDLLSYINPSCFDQV